MTTDLAPVALTATHRDLVTAGAVMGNAGGWLVPLRFSDPAAEIEAARERVGVVEQSHLAKLRVQGPDMPAVLGRLGVHPPVGKASKATVPTPAGGIRVEVAHLADGEAWITAPAGCKGDLGQAVGELVQDAAVFDVTSSFASFRLVGPLAGHIISSLTDIDIRTSAVPDGACAQTMLAEVYALIVRSDLGSLPSYRLFFGREYGLYMWESVAEAGKGRGMAFIGTEALATLEEDC